MRQIPASDRVTVAAHKGWYLSTVGLAATKDALVCTYRKSDGHLASDTTIMAARSEDGGRTWTGHAPLSRLAFDPDRACWVAPQMRGGLAGGRLLLIADRGEKKTREDWPMLSQWQMKDRGMSNWLFASADGGRTWDGPRKIDAVGGEPSYILELSDGTLMYTRTDSKPTTAKKNPSLPWGPNYYRSTAVFSDDQGRTWDRTAVLADDPLVGDCEVGVAEYEAGKLLAVTRIGDGGSGFGQPSRFVRSDDFGKTWRKPALSPIYAHRAIVGKLASGKLLVTYRNAWGTSGSYAFVFDPKEELGYQPNSWIWDESRCRTADGVMEVRTADGATNAVEFCLYPAEDDESVVEVEAELKVAEADKEGCLISAGAWVRFEPKRVSLADRPKEGFDLDATQWHKYRILRKDGQLTIEVDGKEMLTSPVKGIATRHVRFGNRDGGRRDKAKTSVPTTAPAPPTAPGFRPRPLGGARYDGNTSHTFWRSVRARVANRRDHSINWAWHAKDGYPDQFRRDRVVLLERNATFAAGNSGYSSWVQTADGTIVIADYTAGSPAAESTFVRAYVVKEADLAAAASAPATGPVR